VDRTGDDQSFEPEGLRPERGLALEGLVDGLEIVERTAESLHQEKDEGADQGGTDDEEAPPLSTRRR
jgi:hypothetical protein